MKFLTVPEVAAELGMSREYIQRQCRLGNLRAKKLGTTWRVAEDEIEKFMRGEPIAPLARTPRLTARQRRRSA